MKIPTIFIPGKNLDRKLKDLIQDREKTRQINNIESLACISKIEDYCLTGFERIDKQQCSWYFGNHIHKYLITRAGKIKYLKVFSNIFTVIYILEFKNHTNLNEMSKYLEEEFSQETTLIKCLKKDNYLVTINSSKFDKGSLDVIGNFYIKNFGLEEL